LSKATTLGGVQGALADINTLFGTAKSTKETIEKFMNAPAETLQYFAGKWGDAYQGNINKLVETYNQLTSLDLGETNAAIIADQKSAAEAMKSAAEDACRAAKAAAEEAYRNQQAAFRDQFLKPITDALLTGDFEGAAKQIDGLTANFADLVNQGAQLGMSVTDVLGMMTGMRSSLLSAIDGLISISGATPDLVEALQYAKDRITKMWGEGQTPEEKALNEINLQGLIEQPAIAAQKLRELAKSFGDATGVADYTNELIGSLQKEIDAYTVLGYDTTALDEAMREFKAGLIGTSAPFERFMGAIESFSSGLIELADTLIPGFGDILGKVFNLVDAVAGTSGLTFGGGAKKPLLHYAEGGVALVGENGPELITPVSDLPSMTNPFTNAWGNAFENPSVNSLAAPGNQVYSGFADAVAPAIEDLVGTISALASRIAVAASQLAAAIENGVIRVMGATGLANPFAQTQGNAVAAAAREAGVVPTGPVAAATPSGTTSPEMLQNVEQGLEEQMAALNQQMANYTAAIGRSPAAIAQSVTASVPHVAPPGEWTSPQADVSAIAAAACEQFKPDVVAQALAKALTASDITPGKEGEEKKFSSPLLDLIAKWGPTINSAISLAVSAFKFASDAATSLETAAKEAAEALGDRLVKAAGELMNAATSLASNMQSLIASTETYTRLQSALAAFQGKIFDSLMGWAWPLIAIFEKLTGAIDETIDSYNNLNVPTGYKVTRAEWKAATPGEPGEKRAGTESELPEWVSDLLEQFKEAIQAVVDVFKSFFDIMSAVWEELGPILLQGILPSLLSFGEALVGIGEKIRDELLPILKEHLAGTISGFLDFFFGAITATITFFVDTIGAILPNLELFAQSMGDLGATLPGLAAALSDALSPAINTLLEGLTLLSGWITATMIPGLQAALTEFGALWTSNIGPFFTESVFPKILEWVDKIYRFVMDEVVPFFTGTLLPFMENEIWPQFTKIVDDVIQSLKKLWDDLTVKPEALLNFLKGVLEEWGRKIIVGIETLDVLVLQKSGDTLGALREIWTSKSMSVWEQIKLSFSVAFLDIIAAAGRLWDAMAPVLEPLLSILGGALLIALETVAVAFDVLGFAIRLITWPIEVLGTMVWNVIVGIHNALEWIKHPLNPDARDNWEYKEMRAFAGGGIVTKPTMALIGEAGPEVVIPLSGGPVIPGLSGRAASLSGGAMVGGSAGSSDGTILVQTKNVIQMNGRTISSELSNTRRHLSKLGSSNGRAWNPE
jgi:hypothetical protein